MSVTGIDHIVIAVRSLKAAQEALYKAGFIVTPRGERLKLKAVNSLVMLPSAYIELAEPTAPEAAGAILLEQMDAHGEGVAMIAFAKDNISDFAKENDYPYTEANREVDTETMKGIAQFRIAWLPEDTISGAPSFLIEHCTPELLWHPTLEAHENGARRIKSLLLRTDSPHKTAKECSHRLGLHANPHDEITMENNTLKFVSHDDMNSKWGESVRAVISFTGAEKPYAISLFDNKLVLNFVQE